MKQLIRDFFHDECAATAIEYALIAAGISIVIISAVYSVGSSMNARFGTVSAALGGS